jgi:excisionase family DNA binding protein
VKANRPIDPTREVLSLDEACELLGVSRPTLVKRAKLGEVPATRIGQQWRFLRSNLLEMMNGSRRSKAS